MMTYGSILEGVKKVLYWPPRILAVLYIAFFSVFAFDALQNLVAFFIHLIPSLILLCLTSIAWKRERLGGILFCLAGICIGLFYHSVAVAAPAFVIGFMFFQLYSIPKKIYNNRKEKII